MELKAGTRLRSATCSTEVIVVRAGPGDVDLRCGGTPMVGFDAEPVAGAAAPAGDAGPGTVLGKRYVDDGGSVEILCTKAGSGSLSVGDRPLALKEAKPLPSSD
jgi:hypothetical protein